MMMMMIEMGGGGGEKRYKVTTLYSYISRGLTTLQPSNHHGLPRQILVTQPQMLQKNCTKTNKPIHRRSTICKINSTEKKSSDKCRGADKSLARPGRKQSTAIKL